MAVGRAWRLCGWSGRRRSAAGLGRRASRADRHRNTRAAVADVINARFMLKSSQTATYQGCQRAGPTTGPMANARPSAITSSRPAPAFCDASRA